MTPQISIQKILRRTVSVSVDLDEDQIVMIVSDWLKHQPGWPSGIEPKLLGTGAQYEGCDCGMSFGGESKEELDEPPEPPPAPLTPEDEIPF